MTWDRVRAARNRLAGESGTIVKDWGGKLPVALIYPNSYYLGMSNLGIHAIYSLLNRLSDTVCERVFWEAADKIGPLSPVSIESQRELSDFAILAFSITYELDYFNVPQILAAAGIPLYSSERNETHPLIIAGGACITANPMPVSRFFDALCIGEAEAIMPQLLAAVSGVGVGDREGQLSAIARKPGVFSPGRTSKVSRQWAKDLDDFPVHSVVTTRDTELGDLYLIEVERGCRWRCRFCLVCGIFRPMRPRSLESLMDQASAGLKIRRRLGLVGPDVPDHPLFEEILGRLKAMGADISVSSLRIKPLFDLALSELARGGTGSVAFAPEAGSERLRQVIRKGVYEDYILKAVEFTSRHKIRQLRLYFMIGLPTETDDDVVAISDLSLKCKAILEKRQSTTRITLSISPFVPKAGTPFEWLRMEQVNVLEGRIAMLKRTLEPNGIKVGGESPAWSEVQAMLARGDSNMAPVLAGVKHLSLAAWTSALDKARLDRSFVHQDWNPDSSLPWDMIDSGISQDNLRDELRLAISQPAGHDGSSSR